MNDTETPTQPTTPAQRRLGWVGLWLCSALLLPILAVWLHSFRPQRPLSLLHPGGPLFWQAVGIDALFASMTTFSQWQDTKKPKKRRVTKTASPKNRWKPYGAGGLLLGIVVLQMLAANPGAAINWVGAVGGAVAFALLFAGMMYCAKMTQPPHIYDETEAGYSLMSSPNTSALSIITRSQINKYRAEVSAREVIYRRPLSAQVGAIFGGLFFASICGGCFWFTLAGLGLVSASGIRGNPALVAMMGIGFLFFLSAFTAILATMGRRELRVSPMDRTYIYRVCAPVRWEVLTIWMGKSAKEEMGIPWQALEYRGSLSDIAGIRRCEFTYKSNTFYTVLLCWHDPSRPPMRVGFSSDKDEARAKQVQAGEDLGVPRLPDEVI